MILYILSRLFFGLKISNFKIGYTQLVRVPFLHPKRTSRVTCSNSAELVFLWLKWLLQKSGAFVQFFGSNVYKELNTNTDTQNDGKLNFWGVTLTFQNLFDMIFLCFGLHQRLMCGVATLHQHSG